ncbi:hypothetical protein BsWGS_14246 [Bradybaena similaris]
MNEKNPRFLTFWVPKKLYQKGEAGICWQPESGKFCLIKNIWTQHHITNMPAWCGIEIFYLLPIHGQSGIRACRDVDKGVDTWLGDRCCKATTSSMLFGR